MAIEIQKRLYTGEELFEINSHSEQQYELSNGELIEVAPARFSHGEVVLRLGGILINFAVQHKLGSASTEAAYYLKRNPDTVRAPDVSFIKTEKLEKARRTVEGTLDFPPDLAVEVISPSERPGEIMTKLNEYLTAKVPLIWIIYPDEGLVTVAYTDKPLKILSLATGDSLDGYDIVPGFKLPLETVFGII